MDFRRSCGGSIMFYRDYGRSLFGRDAAGRIFVGDITAMYNRYVTVMKQHVTALYPAMKPLRSRYVAAAQPRCYRYVAAM